MDNQRLFQLSASDAIIASRGRRAAGESLLRTFRLRKLRARLADPQRRARAVQAAYRRGLALRQRGSSRRAEAAYRRADPSRSSNPSPHNDLGTVLLDQGRVEPAIAEYRKTLALDPNHPLAHGNLGNALRQPGAMTKRCRNSGEPSPSGRADRTTTTTWGFA